LNAGTFLKFATTTGNSSYSPQYLVVFMGLFQFHARAKERGGVLVKHRSTLPILPIICMASLIAGIGLAAIGMRYKIA
jgi:hypothetical protein